jgi:hypothetical protein
VLEPEYLEIKRSSVEVCRHEHVADQPGHGDVPQLLLARPALRARHRHRRSRRDSIDSRARSALTLGLLSLVLGVLTGIPAVWVGGNALAHISAADGALHGRWAAWGGIVLGMVGVALTVGLWTYLHNN